MAGPSFCSGVGHAYADGDNGLECMLWHRGDVKNYEEDPVRARDVL